MCLCVVLFCGGNASELHPAGHSRSVTRARGGGVGAGERRYQREMEKGLNAIVIHVTRFEMLLMTTSPPKETPLKRSFDDESKAD